MLSNRSTHIKVLWAVVLSTFILTSTSAVGSYINNPSKTLINHQVRDPNSVLQEIPYGGTLKIYVVEPTSRWINRGKAYAFGFLDFALEETLNLDYLDTYTETIIWDGAEAGFSDIAENNTMVIATVFNPERHQGYAYPPFRNPFDAYYVDAAAAALPGETGYNKQSDNFTHTVFLEEATATYCGYCPATRDALESIYNSSDYPFYYVALVGDKNTVAIDHLVHQYNLYGYPTCFIDGGYRTIVGGYEYESPYRNAIESAGKQDVHDLNLSVSLTWLDNSKIQIEVTLVNNEILENSPPEKPATPSGLREGSPEILYNFTTNTTDSDGDDVSYWFDWGDENNSGWTEYKRSGSDIMVAHNWTQKGTYDIKVKAKDTFGKESEWSDPLEIEIPHSRNQQHTVPLTAKGRVTPKMVSTEQFAKITFTVFEGDGCACEPLFEADVWAFGLDVGHNDSNLTDEDGETTLFLEYNFHYRVTIEKENFQTVRFDFQVLDDQEFVIHLKEEDGVSLRKLAILQTFLSNIHNHLPVHFLSQQRFSRIQ